MPFENFIYEALPSRVIFGSGSLAQLGEEMDRLKLSRALILCTPRQRSQAEQLAQQIGSRALAIFDQAAMHVPAAVVEAAVAQARQTAADSCIAWGGGSTIGLAKAIALETGLPYIAIPTTYAGSEMTPIWGLTVSGAKRTGRDARVLARAVIYDPELTLQLPVSVSVTSGINAIAHAAEGLYAREANPISSLMAAEGIRALMDSLPRIHQSPQDAKARHGALYGAWLCGTVLGTVGMALHHKLCHTLGGSFNLPHAETHTVVLPHVLAYNSRHAADAMQRLQAAVGSDSAPNAILELARRHGGPTSLKQLGLRREDVDSVVSQVMANPYWNPRPVDPASLRQLVLRAYEGAEPVCDDSGAI